MESQDSSWNIGVHDAHRREGRTIDSRMHRWQYCPALRARCVDDLHAMLKKAGGWVELGGADEQKPGKEGTVEG